MSTAIVQTAGLCKDYPDGDRVNRVLGSVDLRIERGEFLAVMGPSGCGKTTLLNLLGLMCPPTEARRLEIDGVDCLRLSERQRTALRRNKIGFVFQRFNLLQTVSAAANVGLALRLRGLPADGQVQSALEGVGLGELGHRKPGHLSIGEQQRVAIARAVACSPAVLLADEPTGNLDSGNARMVLDIFRRIHADQGLTIVMITHSPDCAAVADRMVRMADGKLVER
ncbi:MAG: ABC transporter ATP-binding protein [bacterium]|nr:ABC transporter ATP-binding protein [bacterium]